MFEKIKKYFEYELWNFPLSKEKGWRRIRFKWLRISYLTVRGFFQDNCILTASSLTYYTMMAIVPVLALMFAISRGFGYNEVLRTELLAHFQDQSAALIQIFKYSDAFLDQAKNGVIAGIGFVVLFLTVSLLLSSLESILNGIWGVKKLRSWRRIASDYFAVMLITPIFFIFASSASVFILNHLAEAIRSLPMSPWAASSILFFVNLAPYCLFWILFSFVYLFMPNKRVQFSSASLGGLVAACLYLLGQWAYIYFQVGVASYGAVYGSVAALPLILIWIQVSWFIFLLGAEISYAHQTLDEHEFEASAANVSHSFKRLLSLWIVHLSLKGFLSREMLIKRYQIPVALIRPILKELVDCGILHETTDGYVPDQEAQNLKISDVVNALESRGESDFPLIESSSLAPFEKALDRFKFQIDSSPANIRISHVSDSL